MKRLTLTISLLTICLPLALLAQVPPPPPLPPANPSLIPSPAAQAVKSPNGQVSLTLSPNQQMSPGSSPASNALVSLGFFAMIGTIVWVTVAARERQRRISHETIRLMIEKGQTVPPELFLDPKFAGPRNDLRRGVIFIAAGSGVIAFLISIHVNLWTLGLIPILMGVGYIIVWKIEQSAKNNGKPS